MLDVIINFTERKSFICIKKNFLTKPPLKNYNFAFSI